MGRRLKGYPESKAVIVVDKVGEETDLSLCPLCASHPDCFANINGRCTALSRVDESVACAFYKNAEENTAQAKRCYQHLKDAERSDLISKYIKPLSAMGMLDDEIEAAEQYGEQFDTFRESNYQEQLNRALEDDGLDDDLLDDADDPDEEADEEEETEDDADFCIDDEEEDEDAWKPGWTDPGDDGGA